MGKIPVIWLNYSPDLPGRFYWDQGMLEDVFSNRMWRTGYEFRHIDKKIGYLGELEITQLQLAGDPKSELEGAIVVFPARNQVQFVDKLNETIKQLKWVILMLTGDEEAVFPVEKIKHNNIKIWVMSPRPSRHDSYDKLGTGYPPQMRELLPKHAPSKKLDLFFGGQITHKRRENMADVIKEIDNNKDLTGLKVEYEFSKGFTQGLEPSKYYKKLASAKVAPAPSGPETPDSFRLFEALESGCVPIADTRVPKGDFPDDYWTFFFGEIPPFPVTTEWDWLQGWTQDQLKLFPAKNNQIFTWWQHYKRNLALKISQQIYDLSAIERSNTRDDQITILMPSNPVDMHPSTKHIEQTVRDIRVHLPNSEIIIMLDGVRPEREARRADYEEYQRRLLWLCNYEWTNVLPVRFEEFGHQSTMTRKVLEMVKTPFVLFVEHDTPLVPDFSIDWEALCQAIETGEANAIRFHHESLVHPEHKHLMLSGIENVCGAPLMKTAQWSQRPHLASTAFYRHALYTYFKEDSRAFIEHGLYGQIVEAYNREGIYGWNLWKLWLYYPDTPDNIQRSYDLNSRGSGPNFESEF